MRWRVLLQAIAALAALLFAGKLLRLPIALMIVSGSSMEPSLKAYDLVLGVRPSLVGGINEGDIVVWCIDEARWRSSCIIHRVVDIHNVGGVVYVVTKGDALSTPDPPVPVDRISYVIVLHVPRVYTLALAALLGCAGLAYYYIYLPAAVHWMRRLLPPGSAALLMLLAYVIFDIVYVGVAVLDPSPIPVEKPRIYRESIVFNLSNATVGIYISHDETLRPVSAPECSVVRPLNASLELVSYAATGGNVSIVLRVPRKVFLELYKLDSRRAGALPPPPAKLATWLWVGCTLYFDKGVLRSVYGVVFSWKEPTIRVINESSISITNNNPIDINITIEVYSSLRRAVVLRENLTLPSFTSLAIKLSQPLQGDTLNVRIYYTFLSHKRAVGVTIPG